MALALIDTESGEVIKAIAPEEGDSIQIIHKKAKDDSYEPFPFASFVKLNTDEVEYLVKELPKSNISFLMSILPFLSYRDNCLKDRRGNPLSVTDLAEAIGVTRRTATKEVGDLLEADILFRGKNSKEQQLYVNPWVAGKGNIANKVLRNMFRNYKIRSMGGRTWKSISKK